MLRGEEPTIAVGRLVGFRLTGLSDGRATFEMEVGPQHHNPMGTLHGGVLCDLADAAMGVAYSTTLGEDQSFTTLELKINFLRPFWTGRLQAVGWVVKSGRTIGLTECDVTDDQERLVARATSTCMTLHGEDAKGR